jgi:S-DNA-T family DNA segregation ATPase FtsK/SpoIIIE
MILETLLGAGVYLYAEYAKRETTDAQRIQKIFRKCGLVVKYDKKEDTVKLIRSKSHKEYDEYIFRIPDGKSFQDFIDKKQVVEDNLNSTKQILTLSDIKEIDFKGDIRSQIKDLIEKPSTKKEVYMEGDRVLKVNVFKKPLTDHLPYEEIEDKSNEWKVFIGVTRTEVIKHNFEKIMHMVIGGTTQYGKSVFIKNVITTLLRIQPDNVLFTLFDLKGGLTFSRFADCKQVGGRIASDAIESLELLQEINKQMDEVMSFLKRNRFENVREAGIEKRHFIIVDEGAELAPGIEKNPELKPIKHECEAILSRIARIGGALGYRLIYATQTPYSEVLNHNIKQNCDAKLCFRLQTDKASEVVLGEGITDASDLPYIKGRAVYLTDRKHIVQTPMIENDYIERVVQNG